MKIAILGASSQIAKDLIKSFMLNDSYDLYLYTRNPKNLEIQDFCNFYSKFSHVGDFSTFNNNVYFDVIINFVGIGNPEKLTKLGSEILDITFEFDQIALNYIKVNGNCRYVFLSSGAAYGSNFIEPANIDTPSKFIINAFSANNMDWYAISKFYAECRHRSFENLAIIDIRIFNYFSSSQDISSKFFISDIIRSIRDNIVLKTPHFNIVRDYLNPIDFYNLIKIVMKSPIHNCSIDAYTKNPVDKFSLLNFMERKYNLKYKFIKINKLKTNDISKVNYYSLNKHAKKIGYEPLFSSIDGISREADLIFNTGEFKFLI